MQPHGLKTVSSIGSMTGRTPASNKSATSMTSMLAVNGDTETNEEKMSIARSIAQTLLSQSIVTADKKDYLEEQERRRLAAERRAREIKRTLKLVEDPRSTKIYSMPIEMRLITERNIELLLRELDKLCRQENVAFSKLVDTMTEYFRIALFGCSVEIGICTDSNAKVLQYYGDSNYIRKVKRGFSNAFTALDQKQIVVEVMEKSKYRNPSIPYSEGDHVVYVPIFGTSSAQGVMEIYGMQTVAVTDASTYWRSNNALRGMILARDYKFLNTVRLWKKPPTAPKVLENGELGKFYGATAFLVSGFVTGVSTGRRGVPFYGGPRFTITWENGEVDEEVTATDVLHHYRETPQSLGCSTKLDSLMRDKLMEIGNSAGRVLESQRVKTFLRELRGGINAANLRFNGIAEIGIQSIASMISGSREISLIGLLQDSTDELINIADHFPIKKNETDEEELYDYTVKMIAQEIIDQDEENKDSSAIHDNESVSHASVTSITSKTRDFKSGATDQFTNMSTVKNVTVRPDIKDTDWIAAEVEMHPDFIWSKKVNYSRYFVVLNRERLMGQPTSKLDLMVFTDVIEEFIRSIHIVWARDLRKRARKESLKDLDAKLFDWRFASANEICHNAIQHISPHLPDAHIYIGLLLPGGQRMAYVASSLRSKMEGKRLDRGNGVSFDVIDDLNTLVLHADDLNKSRLLAEGATVDVYYGNTKYDGIIEKDRGHEKFDIRYKFDNKVEAGVDISRIIPRSSAFRLKVFNKSEFPFACVAIRNRTKPMGVLGVDTFKNVPKAEHEKHPEPDVLNFLEQIGRLLGATLDTQKKKQSLRSLYTVSKNAFTEVKNIFEAASDIIFANMHFVSSLAAARVVYEFEEARTARGLQMIHNFGSISEDIVNRMKAFNPSKSSLKPIQKFGDRIVWLLCRLRPITKGGQGRLFIIAISCTAPISDPDYEYLDSLQKMITGSLQNIVSHKAITEMRFESLRDIKKLCNDWASFNSRQRFFNSVVDLVQSCFYSANMYVGTLSMHNKSIEYTLASTQSKMVGNILHRHDEKGISFQVMDDRRAVAVSSTAPKAGRLHHFGPRQLFEFPYVAVPIIAHLDAVIGILGVDHCEEPSAVAEQLDDTLSFFIAVGTYLSKAIRGFRAEDARASLLQIAKGCHGYRDGIVEIKKVILNLLPFAQRIVELVYEPKDSPLLPLTQIDEEKRRITDNDYIVLMKILSAESFCDNHVRMPMLEVLWQGRVIYSSIIGKDQACDTAPFVFRIPKSMNVNISFVQLSLMGEVNSIDREIARKMLTLTYLLTSPLYIMEHYFCSTTLRNARAAKVELLTKTYHATQVVGFTVDEVAIKGAMQSVRAFHARRSSTRYSSKSPISGRDSQRQEDVTAQFKWNENIVDETQKKPPHMDIRWSQLDIYMKLDHLELAQNKLLIEILEKRGDGAPGNVYCRLAITGQELHDYFAAAALNNGTGKWLDIPVANPADFDTNTSVDAMEHNNAVIRLRGNFIIAENMDDFHMQQELDLTVANTADLGVVEKDKKYHECELGILNARDLGKSASWSADKAANTFAVVSFNEDEIGRTPVVHNTSHPMWDNEVFKIRVPGDDELELCTLQVELYHLDEARGTEHSLGYVEITGKALTSFLAGTKFKRQWFDLQRKVMENDSATNATDDNIPVMGELKLSGRPAKVAITGDEEDATELGQFEIQVTSFVNMPIIFDEDGSARDPSSANYDDDDDSVNMQILSYFKIFFNDLQIFISQPVRGATEGEWRNQKIIWRFPNNRTLCNCTVKIEMWQRPSEGSDESDDARVGFLFLKEAALSKLLGQSGFITKWLPLSLQSNDYDDNANLIEHEEESRSAKGLIHETPEIRVRAGPVGGLDIYEDQDEEIWLDVLAAFRLPPQTSVEHQLQLDNMTPAQLQMLKKTYIDHRPNAFCEITWNHKKVGRTSVQMHSSNPIWDRQRFTLRVPLITEVIHGNVLSYCKLQIDVYHRIVHEDMDENNTLAGSSFATMSTDVLMASLILTGEDVVQFLDAGSTVTRWFSLWAPKVEKRNSRKQREQANNDSIGFESDEDDDESVSSDGFELDDSAKLDESRKLDCEIKLRGGYAGLGSAKPSTAAASEYLLIIESAEDLSNVDIFGGSDPYAEVEWLGEKIGNTQVIPNTVSPTFIHEAFILKPPMAIMDTTHFKASLDSNHISNLAGFHSHLVGASNTSLAGSVSIHSATTLSSLHYDKSLTVSMFSKRDMTSAAYLGRVYLEGSVITDILRASPTLNYESYCTSAVVADQDDSSVTSANQPDGGSSVATNNPCEYLLTSHPEYTEEENQLVKGSMIFKLYKIEDPPYEFATKKSATLWIVSASNLPRSNAFGIDNDVFCKVYRSNDRDGGGEALIHTSKVARKTVDPRFRDEFVPMDIPAYDDWSGFAIRVEVWDSSPEKLGAILLREEQARELLQRNDSSVLEAHEYPLRSSMYRAVQVVGDLNDETDGEESTVHEQISLDSGPSISSRKLPMIRLAGGLQHEFENYRLTQAEREMDEVMESLTDTYAIAEGNEEEEGEDGNVGDDANISIIGLEVTEKTERYVNIIWNGNNIGRTTTINAAEQDLDWSEEIFTIKLEKDNIMTGSTLVLEIYGSNLQGQPVVTGRATIGAKDLVHLFDPTTEQASFPVESTIHRSQASRKRNARSKIQLVGSIPRLQKEFEDLHAEDVGGEVVVTQSSKSSRTPVDDSNLQTGTIELRILSASNLIRMNKLPGRSTDTYAVIHWNSSHQPIGQTQVVSNSLDPVFDNEIFKLDKRAGLKFSECSIVIKMYHRNFTKADTFLGLVHVTGSELSALIASPDIKEFPLILEERKPAVAASSSSLSDKEMDASNTELANDNSENTGDVVNGTDATNSDAKVGAVAEVSSQAVRPSAMSWLFSGGSRVASSASTAVTIQGSLKIITKLVKEPMKSPIFNSSLPLPSHLQEFDVTILAARDLGRANTFGSSDPCGEINWGAATLGQTSVINESMNPIWDDPQSFTIRVPARWSSAIKEDGGGRSRRGRQSFLSSVAEEEGEHVPGIDVDARDDCRAAVAPNLNRGPSLGSLRGSSAFGSVRGFGRSLKGSASRKNTADLADLDGFQVEDLCLHIALRDWNMVGKHAFLGCVTLVGNELKDFLNSTYGKLYATHWVPLTISDRLPKSDQKLVQGQILLLITRKTPRNNDSLSPSKADKVSAQISAAGSDDRVVEVAVERAWQLPDGIMGSQNPNAFIKYRWNGKPISRSLLTKVIRGLPPPAVNAPQNRKNENSDTGIETDGGNPSHSVEQSSMPPKLFDHHLYALWEDEYSRIDIPSEVPLDLGKLDFELWFVGGRRNNAEQYVATASIEGEALQQAIEDDSFAAVELKLRRSELIPQAWHISLPSHTDGASSVGNLTIRMGIVGAHLLSPGEGHVTYEITIHGAKGLGKADTLLGISDPYLICKWNGREVGRTAVAPRTINPVWDGEKVLISADIEGEDTDIDALELELQMWNSRQHVKGEFLGSVHYSGATLLELLNEATKHGRQWVKLTESPHIDKSRQQLVKGRIEISVRSINGPESSSAVSMQSALNMQWRDLYDSADGDPMLLVRLNSVEDIPAIEEDQDTGFLSAAAKDILGKHLKDVSTGAIIYWDGDEICTQIASVNTITNEVYWQQQDVLLRIPQHADKIITTLMLRIEFWDFVGGKPRAFLGMVQLSFASLLRIHLGDLVFPLVDRTESSEQRQMRSGHIRGTASFHIDFKYPHWDFTQPVIPRHFMRKIRINGAANFPYVNENPPNTKCVISIDGGIKTKTTVLINNQSPRWPPVECDVVVDTNKPMEVLVVVYHVTRKEKREIILGQEVIPFEYLLRPPPEVFDVFLGPPAHRTVGFKFTTSGSVKLQIFGTNTPGETSLPYCMQASRPQQAWLARDVRSVGRDDLTKTEMALNGDILTPDERLWLGTACDFIAPKMVLGQHSWITCPLQDLGMKLGPRRRDMFGTRPGFRFALGIEREQGCSNTSDATLLADIASDVSNCIVQLRKKDIFNTIRNLMLNNLRIAINEFVKAGDFSTSKVMQLINEAVTLCFPGVCLRTAVVSQDFNTLIYTSYTSSGQEKSEIVLHRGQGCDWETVGRSHVHSIVLKSIHDLNDDTMRNSTEVPTLATFEPFPSTSMPRFTVPLRSGDAALGFFQIDNFTAYKGGLTGHLNDEQEARRWFEAVGEVCGDSLYTGMENKVLESIETYCYCWNSDVETLIAEVLTDCFDVVQGCKLMEVLSIDADYRIQSLMQRSPVHISTAGHEVLVKSMKFDLHKENALRRASSKLSRAPSMRSKGQTKVVASAKGIVQGTGANAMNFLRRMTVVPSKKAAQQSVRISAPAPSVKAGSIETASEAQDIASLAAPTMKKRNNSVYFGDIYDDDEEQDAFGSSATDEYDDEESSMKRQIRAMQKKVMLAGIRYGDMEQLRLAHFDSATNSFTVQEIRVILKNDRTMHISLYEIDDEFNLKEEYTGKTNFITYEEEELKCSLAPPTRSGITSTNPTQFNTKLSLHWPTQYVFSNLITNDANLKGFTLNIKRARDLLAADSNGTSDPFCEIHYGDKYIDQTGVISKDLAPEWDESFDIAYKKQPSSIFIDVYDMNFMRKGAFLGRVEITHQQLLNSTGEDIEYPLSMRSNMNVKKQKKVGGILTVSFTCKLKQLGDDGDDDWAKVDPLQVEIPSDLWTMQNPSIELGVESAKGLARANIFGGSSDPFVMIFVGKDATEPIEKTKVIDNTLNPEWKEKFIINLGITNAEKGKTTLHDFPTLRLEVYDYNLVKAMDFLGMCEIPPARYFSRNFADLKLIPMKEKKKNLVQGTMHVTMKLTDNVVGITKPDFIFSPSRTLPALAYVEIHILRAKNLMKANRVGGKSDPFVIVRWNGKKYGETKYKKNTLAPTWNNEKFLFNVNSEGFNVGNVCLEVWDKDFFKEGDFMGEVRLDSNIILHPPNTVMEMPLRPRPGQQQGKIKGTLSFKLIKRWITQRPVCLQQKVSEWEPPPEKYDPMTLIMAYDPEQETKRQRRENIEFPTIVEKTTKQMEKYLTHPFERTGLISELHYGQICDAARRAEQTILKSPKADMICIPTYEKQMKVNKRLYLMARYESQQIPRRDITFLQRLHDGICRGIKHMNEREERIEKLKNLEESLSSLSSTSESPSMIIKRGLLELEVALQCPAKLYMLDSDSKTFVRYSMETGEANKAEVVPDLIPLSARICRHDFIIQRYRGESTIINGEWADFTQLTLPTIDGEAGAVQIFDLLEGVNTLYRVLALAQEVSQDGLMLLPLLGQGEVLLGMLLISDLDRIPHALYRLAVEAKGDSNKDQSTRKSNLEDTKPENSSSSLRNNLKPYTAVKKMEHGIANHLRDCSRHFAAAIFSSQIRNAFRRMKSFPITSTTNLLLLIRYIFRTLVEAIPAIREISLWAVDVKAEVRMIHAEAEESEKKQGMLSKLLGLSFNSKSLKKPTSTASGGDVTKESASAGAVEAPITPTTTDAELKLRITEEINQKFLHNQKKPPILAGFFGSEDPQYLLGTALERSALSRTSNRRGAVQRPTISSQASAATAGATAGPDVTPETELQQKAFEEIAKWRIDVPQSLQVAHSIGSASDAKLPVVMNSDSRPAAAAAQSPLASDRPLSPLQRKTLRQGKLSEYDATKVNLVHAEIVRCFSFLQENSLRTFSGHALSQIGSTGAAYRCLNKIFKKAMESDENSMNDVMSDGVISPLSPGSPMSPGNTAAVISPGLSSARRTSSASTRRESNTNLTTPAARVAHKMREAGANAQERLRSPRNSNASSVSPRSSSATPSRVNVPTPSSTRSRSVGAKQRSTQFSFRGVGHQQSMDTIVSADGDGGSVAGGSITSMRRRTSSRAAAPPLPDGSPLLNTSRRIPPALLSDASRSSIVSPSQRFRPRPPSSRLSERSARGSVVTETEEEIQPSRDYKFFIAVATNGVGGQDGWGIAGDGLTNVIASVAEIMDQNLEKLVNKVNLKQSEAKSLKERENEDEHDDSDSELSDSDFSGSQGGQSITGNDTDQRNNHSFTSGMSSKRKSLLETATASGKMTPSFKSPIGSPALSATGSSKHKSFLKMATSNNMNADRPTSGSAISPWGGSRAGSSNIIHRSDTSTSLSRVGSAAGTPISSRAAGTSPAQGRMSSPGLAARSGSTVSTRSPIPARSGSTISRRQSSMSPSRTSTAKEIDIEEVD